MTRMRQSGRLPRPLSTLGCALALGAAAGLAVPPAVAANRSTPVYGVRIAPDGNANAESLTRLVDSLRGDHDGGPRHLMLMVHGFSATPESAQAQYALLAKRLDEGFGEVDEQRAVVGVYWNSFPGALEHWLPKAVTKRVLQGIGLGSRVRDPYDTVVWRAHGVGRRGLREVIFRLQETFPKAQVHLLTHSLGANVGMNALAPDLIADATDRAPAFQPERELKVDSMFLAGADLDENLFVRGHRVAAARAALDRSRLWWFTVPEPGKRDEVLQIRKMDVGRAAIGNTGPNLAPEDAARLLRERRLVIDLGHVPSAHWFVDYYRKGRCEAVATAISRLSETGVRIAQPAPDPARVEAGAPAAAPARDILRAIDEVLAAPATAEALTPFLSSPVPAARLYATFRLDGQETNPEGLFGKEFSIPTALHAISAAKTAVRVEPDPARGAR